MGVKRGRGRSREGDGEDNNPRGIVCVEPHRVLPRIVVPDNIIGGGWETQGFQYGSNEKQGFGVEEVVWVSVEQNVTGGDVRFAFYNNGARCWLQCGGDME